MFFSPLIQIIDHDDPYFCFITAAGLKGEFILHENLQFK